MILTNYPILHEGLKSFGAYNHENSYDGKNPPGHVSSYFGIFQGAVLECD